MVALVCDQGSNNRSFIQHLEKVTIDRPYLVITWALGVFEDRTKLSVYFNTRINQDCVENLFSIICGFGGHRDNPDVEQLKSSFKYVVADKLFVQSDASNCKVDNDKILLDVSNIAMAKYVICMVSPNKCRKTYRCRYCSNCTTTIIKCNTECGSIHGRLFTIESTCIWLWWMFRATNLTKVASSFSRDVFLYLCSWKNIQRRRFFGPSNIDNGHLCWTS